MTESPGFCVIIGAGPGLGAALARRFAAEGHHLALLSRSADDGTAIAEELRGGGTQVVTAALDAADAAAVARTLQAIALEHGPIDVLIYNATAATFARPRELSVETLIADLRVSIGGALVAAQTVAPAMTARGQGSILLTGGGFALYPQAQLASLGIGKAGLRNLAFTLAEELSPLGVRVGTVTIMGTIAPGSPLDPARIADAFWSIHTDREGKLGPEVQFTGG